MAWQDLLTYKEGKFEPDKATVEKVAKGTRKKKEEGRGCEHCPLNEKPGIQKVKGLVNVKGRRIMIWSQNPGAEENRERKVLTGSAGQFLWKHGKTVGLYREDCDLQTVVRCWPTEHDEYDALTQREPSKEEIKACSIYTEEAIQLNQGKARVHLVFGLVAAKALLKGEFRKTQKTFYSESLKAWVICTYHPTYFLRGGVSQEKLNDWIEAISAAVKKLEQEPGQFTYIDKQDYKAVKAADLKTEIEEPIFAHPGRVVVDIEDDVDENGNHFLVYVGFCWKKGHSRGVFIDHPLAKQPKSARDAKFAMVKRILESKEVRKAAHHGSHEVDVLKAVGINLVGYEFDTEYSEFFRFPAARAYGLAAIADRRFREFAAYKGMLDPYKNPETNEFRMSQVAPELIVKYNGVDCDLTKRIEISNASRMSPKLKELMKVYLHTGIMLARMELRGPLFDSEYDATLEKWIPVKLAKLQKAIGKIAGNPDFNVNAVKNQLAPLIYDKLKLGQYLEESWREEHLRATGEETLLLLKDYHELPELVIAWRKLKKIQSTYRMAFQESAQRHHGRIRTKWWMTGTISSRLSSGGEKNLPKKQKKGIVNLQNIHGDPAVECMLVSDLAWRDVVKDWQRNKSSAQSTEASA